MKRKNKIQSIARITGTIFVLAGVVLLLKTFYKPQNEYKGIFLTNHFDTAQGAPEIPSDSRIKLDDGTVYFVNTQKIQSVPQDGAYVQLTGTLNEDTLMAESITEITDDPKHPPESSASGTSKKTLIIKFNFTDDTRDPVSSSKLRDIFINSSTSVNKFFTEDSFGKFTGVDQGSLQIVGSYTINYKKADCMSSYIPGIYAWESWTQEALLKAAHDTDPGQFDLVIFIFPQNSLCRWDGTVGIPLIGSSPGRIIAMNGDLNSAKYVHEISHILGLGHANICTDMTCYTVKRYGDPIDPMSTCCSIPGHHSSAFKAQLQWITPYSAAVTDSGTTYRLYNIETKTSNVQTLQFPKKNSGETYYLTYRNKTGFDNQGSIKKAVEIHVYSQKIAPGDPVLEDSIRGTYSTYYRGEFVKGETYTDAQSGVEMHVDDITTDYATVTIWKVGNFSGQGTIIPTQPPQGGTATPIPIVKIGGYVWDTNLNGVSGKKITVEGYGSAGYWKAFYPVSGTGGYWIQGGFIAHEGPYNVKLDGVAKTISDTNSRQYPSQVDVPQGSTSYLNQKADFWDCSTVQNYRCNFLVHVPLDTASTISDISTFIYHPSSNPQGKDQYKRTLLSTDGKTFYTKTCIFQNWDQYPTACSGYSSGSVGTPGPVFGYNSFVYTASGSFRLHQSYVATDGWTEYWRDCTLDANSGGVSNCTPFSSARIPTPAAVHGVAVSYYIGKIRQTFVSLDGSKFYTRTCKFDAVAKVTSGCGGFSTQGTPAKANGLGEALYTDVYGRLRIQQFLIAADGRTTYFRNCTTDSSLNYSCPAFY